MLDHDHALRVIADHFGVPVEDVAEHSLLTHDLGADSLDHVELTLRLENEFNVQIDDEEAEACNQVGDVLRTLRRLLGEAGPQQASA